MIFHVSTAEGAASSGEARGEGLKVFAETCPQYLFQTRDDLDRPGLEGAKWMCSPPHRTASDQEALWRALELGDLQTVSSDHAPFGLTRPESSEPARAPTFKQIGNGQPGLETRLPVLFDAMVTKGRLGIAASSSRSRPRRRPASTTCHAKDPSQLGWMPTSRYGIRSASDAVRRRWSVMPRVIRLIPAVPSRAGPRRCWSAANP